MGCAERPTVGRPAKPLKLLRWQDVNFDKGFIHILKRADA
jgi:hypothetical protein